MKRGEPLKRGKPLERGKPIKSVSDKKRAQTGRERKTKREALKRDRGCVARRYQGMVLADGVTVPFCYGRLEKDEIISRARGGDPTELDAVQILCAIHNRWKEDHPIAAETLGLARHSWERDA